jgi:ribosomal protein RSM22 (predicted rRNA methylase)
MNAFALVRPLEDDWRDTLDAVARARGWPTSQEPARLAKELARLSEAYNRGEDEARSVRQSPGARLVFTFARDVPKGAGAVRELVATGALAMPGDRPLRVLDVGAGLGAMTWGLGRALEAAGARGAIDALWMDEDAQALDVAQEIAKRRARGFGGAPQDARADARVSVTPRTLAASLPASGALRPAKAGGARDRFDVVLVGQVLSEHGRDEGDRVARHVELLTALAKDSLAPGGSLVVVEPALRDRTRHLHAVRDALLARGGGLTVFAPCLHAERCPALAHPGDWCHEDLAVDLPPWLIPVARGAGLRWEGLTFSYLVLRTDGRTLRAALPSKGPLLRVVSGALVSKGKREALLCGELASGPGRVRARRLDRDMAPRNAVWDSLPRGAVVSVVPPLSADSPRIGETAGLEVVSPGELPIDSERTPQ